MSRCVGQRDFGVMTSKYIGPHHIRKENFPFRLFAFTLSINRSEQPRLPNRHSQQLRKS
jgi:hypothetical protein